jgi:hypothetical protein
MENSLNSDCIEADLVRSQALIHLINAKITVGVFPRAGGKTSGGIGPRIVNLMEKMPRAQVGLVTDTYERMHKALVPSIENFLNDKLGLIEGVDYVKYKRPPEHWTQPFFKPARYDYVISFSNGFCLCEISLAVPGSGNGFNLQAVIGDEIKYWDYAKFKSEVKPAIRGCKKHFGHLAEFQSQWLFTDKVPSKGANIQWVLDLVKRMKKESVQLIFDIQLYLLRLKEEQEQYSSTETIYKYEHRIKEGEELLVQLRKTCFYYCDALAYENRVNLGDEYFDDQREELSAFEYPDYSPRHKYHSKILYDPNKSLIITLDYQFRITPVVTAQFCRLEDSPYTTLNFVKSLHTLHPDTMQAALDAWHKLFGDHPERHVYYIYNHTAIGRRSSGATFHDTVMSHLANLGWAVTDIYTGDTPNHDIKFEAIRRHLQKHNCDDAVLINEEENFFMDKSISGTGAVLGSKGETKKDKSSEKSLKMPAEFSTHYSDAFDDLVWGALELGLIPRNDDPGLDMRIG